MEKYTDLFRQCLLECNDISDQEAVRRYVHGLKPEKQKWVQMMMGDQVTLLHYVCQIAECHDSTNFA